jgi:hypothetical protein
MTADVQDLKRVGRYVKESDPETVRRLRADGRSTSALEVGRYVLASDPEMFYGTLDYVLEQ